jgi:glycerol-3-phosphate O-acyltransferase
VTEGVTPRGRVAQALGVLHYLTWNAARLLTGRLRRYGRVAVNFGAPRSLREWVAGNPGVLDLPRADRLPRVQGLADELLDRIAAIVPVTAVPLAAAALLSFGETAVRRADLLGRITDYRDHLLARDAKLLHADTEAAAILERAWRTFGMRRLAVRDGETYVVLPSQRPLLEFYANSIRHLLPRPAPRSGDHPVREEDVSLPKLRGREDVRT